mmetsp:Transcript_3031/g.3603  ORF Transcript_3031/g.3603 Transcript_3031/m.3603 type:complete len:352 (-) Transcript_3031:32-1087(-)
MWSQPYAAQQYGNVPVNAAGFYSANSGMNSWVLSAEQAQRQASLQTKQAAVATKQMAAQPAQAQFATYAPVQATEFSTSWYAHQPVQPTYVTAPMGMHPGQTFQMVPAHMIKPEFYTYAAKPQDWRAPHNKGRYDKKRGGSDIEDEIQSQNLYKTELCRSFEETGSCRYGAKCQFAHGKAELRPVMRHPKYKTEVCKTFHTIGTCPYGKRCRFIHSRSSSPKKPAPGGAASKSRSISPPSAIARPAADPPAKAPEEDVTAVADVEAEIQKLQEHVSSMSVGSKGFVSVTGSEWPTVWNTPNIAAPASPAASDATTPVAVAAAVDTAENSDVSPEDDGRRLEFFQSIAEQFS